MDDCLDLVGEEKAVGKTLRSDLDKGSLSLPVIYLAQQMSPKEKTQLFAPLKRQQPDRAFLSRVAKAAHRAGTVTQALQRAQQFLQQAAETVSGDGVGCSDTFHQLARYAMTRAR